MARGFTIDSGNTARLLARGFAIDSGGVARRANRVFVVDSGNISRLVYTGDVINITDQGISDSATGSPSVATYTLNSSGAAQRYLLNGGGTSDIEAWITPQTNMSSYTVRFHLNSGDTPNIGDVLDTDLNLGTSRGVGISRAFTGSVGFVVLAIIKRASDSATMDTALITVSATYS